MRDLFDDGVWQPFFCLKSSNKLRIMNQFDQRINALRIEFRNERISIQKDSNRTIGHINTAIGQTQFPEVREMLRAEKQRVYEATRQSMRYNRLCYLQQLELLQDEYTLYLAAHPSKRSQRK